MKVFRAKVTKISIPDNNGEQQRKIYVTPYPYTDFNVQSWVANPPTPIPTSKYGAGVISYPEIGQECIVFEEAGQRQILSYTRPRNASPYGQLIPQQLSEGSTTLTAGGLKPASLILGKNGQISMFSSLFAQVSVDGDKGEVLLKGKTAKIEALGGSQHYLYDKDSKETQYRAVFYKHKENPGFTDSDKRIEKGYAQLLPKFPSQYKYVDKAIVLAGHIPGRTHLYEIQTRQSSHNINSQDKTVVTNALMGFQEKHERFDGLQYAEGSLVELSAKKNIQGDTGLFKFRYGKLKSDNANSVDRGEILGLYVYEGTDSNKAYGSQITDPTGEGKGWGVKYSKQHNYKYIHSFGKLNSGTEDYKNSIHREFTWAKDADLLRTTIVGGKYSLNYHLAHGSIVSDKIIGGPDSLYVRKVNNENTSFQEVVEGDSLFLQEIESGSTKYTHQLEKDKLSVTFEKNGKKESIKVESSNVEIENSSGAKLNLDGDDIILKSGGSTFKITPKGLTFNGKALVFEDLITTLANAPTWTMGSAPGTPEPPFPALVTQLKLPNLKTN